ncbi:putative DNA helicase ino80 [Podila clonocystis]|nr:putative DNA helicase ino80 [Podila clonocystis]
MTDRGRGPVGRPASGPAPPQPQPASGYRIPPQSYEYAHDREPLERRHDFDQDRAPLHQHHSHARYNSYDDDRHHLAHTQHPQPYRRGYEDYPAYPPDHTPASASSQYRSYPAPSQPHRPATHHTPPASREGLTTGYSSHAYDHTHPSRETTYPGYSAYTRPRSLSPPARPSGPVTAHTGVHGAHTGAHYNSRYPTSPEPYGSPPSGSIDYLPYSGSRHLVDAHRIPSYRHEYPEPEPTRESDRQPDRVAPATSLWSSSEYSSRSHLSSHGSYYQSTRSGYPDPAGRSTSPYQYSARHGSSPPPVSTSSYESGLHPSHRVSSANPTASNWSTGRSPEQRSRSAVAYRRRSTSADDGVEREKAYYMHGHHGHTGFQRRSQSPPWNMASSPRGRSPVRYQQYESAQRRSSADYTYIPSRSPSPIPTSYTARRPQAMSISQLVDDRTSRDISPEDLDRGHPGHHVQGRRPRSPSPPSPIQSRGRSPSRGGFSSPPQRAVDTTRTPGQIADRARMLPLGDRSPSSHNHDYDRVTAPRDRNYQEPKRDASPAAHTPVRHGRGDHSESPEEARLGSLTTDIRSEAGGTPKLSHSQPPQLSPTQTKRRPKAEQDKRSTKPKMEENPSVPPTPEGSLLSAPVKVKAKRGRKPKNKDSLPTSESSQAYTNGAATKRSRPAESGLEEQEGFDQDRPVDDGDDADQESMSGAEPGRDGPREDYSKHKDLMTYMLDVHKRGQKVQKTYDAQSAQKRRKLHEKFVAKQEKRLESGTPSEAATDQNDDEDEGYLGSQAPGTSNPLGLPLPITKGRGRGRKKVHILGSIKAEGDELARKETKAERKRREKKMAAEAAALAQVRAMAKIREHGHQAPETPQEESDDQDANVLGTNTYEDESDEPDYEETPRRTLDPLEDERSEIGQNDAMDEESIARRQDREYESKRRAIWDLIAHRQVREMTKILASSSSTKAQNCKKVAQLCQREIRKVAARSVKTSKEIHARARKVNREMLLFWKRNEREERELRKKAEKEAIEKLRVEEEMREARRQARKLNFLITQTELYSHFIGKKIGTEAAEADDDSVRVRMQPTADPSEMAIAQDPNHTPVEGELDFEEATDEALEAQAKWGAQQALLAAQERTKNFDESVKEHREDRSNIALNQSDLDEMNFQNPSSMPTITEIEQPKMLMCQLKGYQIKGLNWLANLYEQGINGILADEMGLGKTVQSISLMAHLAESQNIWGPFLVIAPASTLHNWQQEFTKFTPDLKALPYWGTISDRKTLRKFWLKKQVYNKDAPFHVIITSYQLVVADEKYFQRVKWQYMVLDEAQAIKSSSSNRWKTLLGFNCRNRLLLTGTPIQNSMQELWALLHFIMPSLFDSHEEFSEWFSKDIESHAENKGTLNEHQLKRLHMILKPFMLRRIKKNVQNELGDKIELEISCELTARQRALYRGLKEKISIAELLEKASSLNDTDSVDSLMNLVMQFRKVCNHPELFERADVVSPLALCSFSQTPSIAREGEDLYVAYTTKSQISYTIPKKLYRDGGLLNVPSEGSQAGSDTRHLDLLFNIWTPDYIAESMFEEGGAFSFLRFSDYSPAQASKIFRGGLLDRFVQHVETSELRSRRSHSLGFEEDDEDTSSSSTFARFLISELSDPFSLANQSLLGHTKDLGRVLSKSELGEYLPMMQPAYRPKAVAPPINIFCSDRTFLVDQQRTLFDHQMRQMLLGVSELMTEAPYQPKPDSPVSDLWNVNSGRGLLGEPSLSSMGYSTIEVPQMKQLVMDSGKLAVLDKLLVELKAGGHRVLVYFQMTKMIDLMEEYLTYRQYKYLRLDGSSKISDRRDMVTDWQTRPEIFIFLLSTRAGGLGINLTAADTVIFYDSDWNPTVDQQAMDRAHRLGQTRQVTVYRLITKGTIEERILQRAKQKDEIQKVVISGGEFKQNVDFKPREIVSLLLDDDELASKLQEQQLKRKAEEEEAKNSRKGGSSSSGGRPSKRSKKDDSSSSTTGDVSGSATPRQGRTLDEMWTEMENRGDATPEGSEEKPKGKRGAKAKVPREPKPKKEKEPKVKKASKLGKKAQAAADAAAAATALLMGGGEEMEDIDL